MIFISIWEKLGKISAGTQYIDILVIGFKEIGTPHYDKYNTCQQKIGRKCRGFSTLQGVQFQLLEQVLQF